MSWFTSLVSDAGSALVGSVSKGLDSLFTSDEERLEANLLIQKEVNAYQVKVMDAQSKYDAEITARWKSDNENFITRLVRPISYISVLLTFFFIAFFDGNVGDFKINPAYIPVFEGLLYTMTIAYFGSRGIEKVTKVVKAPPQNEWK